MELDWQPIDTAVGDGPEVTPEMVEAGRAALWPTEVVEYQDDGEVLDRVYRAMRRLEPLPHQKD